MGSEMCIRDSPSTTVGEDTRSVPSATAGEDFAAYVSLGVCAMDLGVVGTEGATLTGGDGPGLLTPNSAAVLAFWVNFGAMPTEPRACQPASKTNAAIPARCS